MDTPHNVETVLNALQRKHKAFLVGGCVRDSLLGKVPKDFDVTTSATPEQVQELFEDNLLFKVVDTGLKHGTVTVFVIGFKEGVEVTTFRTEGTYSDNRRPDEVSFVTDEKEDVMRRDFTINGLLHDGERVVDHVGGLDDLRLGVVRAIGSPHARFREDGLRMLRAVRFANTLGFDLDAETGKGIWSNSHLLANISKERINDELSKILLSGKPSRGLRRLVRLNLLQYIIPELLPSVGFDQMNKHHYQDVWEHTLTVVDATPPILVVRLSALLHDVAKPECFTYDDVGQQGHFYKHDLVGSEVAEKILRRLTFSNDVVEEVVNIVFRHAQDWKNFLTNKKSVKKFLRAVPESQVDNHVSLWIADREAHVDVPSSEFFDIFKDLVRDVLDEKEAFDIKHLAVNGHDVMEAGLLPSPRIGEILDALLEQVIDGQLLNERDVLLKQLHYIVADDMGINDMMDSLPGAK